MRREEIEGKPGEIGLRIGDGSDFVGELLSILMPLRKEREAYGSIDSHLIGGHDLDGFHVVERIVQCL